MCLCDPNKRTPFCGKPGCEMPKQANALNSDVSADEARALHRVVRAMHDGNCPDCGHLGPASSFEGHCNVLINEDDQEIPVLMSHRCPVCGFTVTAEEAQAALAEFHQYMAANCEVFKRWRERLKK